MIFVLLHTLVTRSPYVLGDHKCKPIASTATPKLITHLAITICLSFVVLLDSGVVLLVAWEAGNMKARGGGLAGHCVTLLLVGGEETKPRTIAMLLQNLIVVCCLLLSFISLSESFIGVQCLRHAQRNSLLAAKRFGWLNRNKESNTGSNKNDEDDDFSLVTPKKFSQERTVTARPKTFPATTVAAKSNFNQNHKIVQRALGPLERKPLSELTVGEKLRGRIITITK